jgi:uncharacterized protein (DUF1330 family)
MYKKCPHCNRVKSHKEYYLDNRSLNKITSWCKVCEKEKTRKYKIKNKGKIRQYQENYMKLYIERKKFEEKIDYEERICNFKNCQTILSSYNNSQYCSIHVKKDLLT